MASHALRFVSKTPLLTDLRATASVFAINLFFAHAALAGTCSYPSTTVTLSATPALECTQGPQNCDPPIQPGVDPASQLSSTMGALTSCVFGGDDPPVTLRPDFGTGSGITFQGLGSTTQAGKCPPAIGVNNTQVGQFNCPTYSVSNTPNIPAFANTLQLDQQNTNLNQAPVCLPAGTNSIPVLPCGGAIPMLAQNVSVTGNLQASNSINLGSGITIGMPPSTLSSTPQTIANSLANGNSSCGSNSVLSLPGNVVNLVLPPTPTLPNIPTPPTPLNGGSITTNVTNGNLGLPVVSLPPESTYSWSTASNNTVNDTISLPQGGTYTDINNNTITFPPNAVLINSGKGYVVWANGGNTGASDGSNLQPVDTFGLGSFVGAVGTQTPPKVYLQPGASMSYWCTNGGTYSGGTALSGSALSQCIADGAYVQQSVAVSSVAATDLSQTPQSTLIAANAPGSVFTLDWCAYYQDGSCPVTYVTGQYIPVGDPMQINASQVELMSSAGSTTTQTENLSVPSGAYMRIPSGTPVGFNVDGNNSITLPAGGSFQSPSGSYSIPQGGTLTSLGGGNVQLPNGQTVSFGSATSMININTTEVQVPAGVQVPVNLNSAAQLNLPQTVAANPPASCGSLSASVPSANPAAALSGFPSMANLGSSGLAPPAPVIAPPSPVIAPPSPVTDPPSPVTDPQPPVTDPQPPVIAPPPDPRG